MLLTTLSSSSFIDRVGGLNSMLDSGGGGSSGPNRGRDIIAVILFAPSSPAEVAMSLCSCSSARLWADQDCGGVGSAEVWCVSSRRGSSSMMWLVILDLLGIIIFCSDLGPVCVLHVLLNESGLTEFYHVAISLNFESTSTVTCIYVIHINMHVKLWPMMSKIHAIDK